MRKLNSSTWLTTSKWKICWWKCWRTAVWNHPNISKTSRHDKYWCTSRVVVAIFNDGKARSVDFVQTGLAASKTSRKLAGSSDGRSESAPERRNCGQDSIVERWRRAPFWTVFLIGLPANFEKIHTLRTPSWSGQLIIKLSGFLKEKQIDVAFIIKTHLKPKVSATILNSRLVYLDRTNFGGRSGNCFTKQHRLPSADVKHLGFRRETICNFHRKIFGKNVWNFYGKTSRLFTGNYLKFLQLIICNFFS